MLAPGHRRICIRAAEKLENFKTSSHVYQSYLCGDINDRIARQCCLDGCLCPFAKYPKERSRRCAIIKVLIYKISNIYNSIILHLSEPTVRFKCKLVAKEILF